MKYRFQLTLIVLVSTCGLLFSQTEELFDIAFQSSVGQAMESLKPRCSDLRVVPVDPPVFPLARNSETHLVCEELATANGIISEIVFTFADDSLKMVQARGNAVEVITGNRKDTAARYIDFKVYWEDFLHIRPKDGTVWMLTPEAAHPNLFLWDNPYLPSNGAGSEIYATGARLPEFIEMGGTLEDLQPQLEKAAEFSQLLELDGSDPNAQLQIDAFGIEYAGFPRKIEARFGQGKLNVLWILTGKGEEDRIRTKLLNTYGPVIYNNEAWEVFADWQVFLRKDKPEVLFLTEELGKYYKKEYFGQ